ncbi:MAG: hypothetical protein QXG01_01920 [Candidatus Bathyarchaeia archaeon]
MLALNFSAINAHQEQGSMNSASNEVLEFYIEGEAKKGDYAIVSNEGGFLKLEGNFIKVLPWHHVVWKERNGWVFFLVNVTSKNFMMAYVYILKAYPYHFFIKTFDYASKSIKTYTFGGNWEVGNELVKTPSIKIPKLSLPINSETSNGPQFHILGENISLAGGPGYFINNTSTLKVYPLYQFSTSGGEQNELWVLMVDESKNFYYYSIIYSFKSDKKHVMMGHTLRLNDCYTPDWITLEASWSTLPFPHLLTIKSQFHNVSVKVDGFPFFTNEDGVLKVRVPSGLRRLEAQRTIALNDGSQAFFVDWSDGESANPKSIIVKGDLVLRINYEKRFRVIVESEYGNPKGEGWYGSGALANISVETLVNDGNETRVLFGGWEGDTRSKSANVSVKVDGLKILKANWKKQHLISFLTEGLPEGAPVSLLIDGKSYGGYAPKVYDGWFNESSSIDFYLASSNITFNGKLYNFEDWKDSGGKPIGFPYKVKKPEALIAIFSMKSIFSSKISCEASPRFLIANDVVNITGSVSPPRKKVDVTIYYSQNDFEWFEIANIKTGSEGEFSYTWEPPKTGKIFIKAGWRGDNEYIGAFSQSIVVYNFYYGSILDEVAGNFFGKLSLSNSNIFKTVLTPAQKILALNSMLKDSLEIDEKTSQPISYFIIGFLLGLVYISPIILLIVIVKKYRVRLSNVKPIILVWIISLAFVLIGAFTSLMVIAPLGILLFILTSLLLGALFPALIASKLIS